MTSIIIPFCNREQLMPRLFASLSEINIPDVEIVFVDNGSTQSASDYVESEVKQLVRHNHFLTAYIIKETHPGAAVARNAGLKAAHGDYVCFFDSDDEFSPQMLTDALPLIQSHTVDVVGLQTQIVFDNGVMKNKRLVKSSDPFYQLTRNNLATQSLLLKRDFALKNALWNESLFYWNDLEWGFRVLLSKPDIVWLPGCYHRIYAHADSITGRNFSDAVDKIMLAHKTISADITDSALSYEEKHRLLKALNFRKAIYAGYVCKEGNSIKSKNILSTIDKSVGSWTHMFKLKLLFYLSKKGLPGVYLLA